DRPLARLLIHTYGDEHAGHALSDLGLRGGWLAGLFVDLGSLVGTTHGTDQRASISAQPGANGNARRPDNRADRSASDRTDCCAYPTGLGGSRAGLVGTG